MVNPIRQWRTNLGLTQPSCAQSVGVAQSTLGRIEKGHGCTADTAWKFIQFSDGALDLLDLVSDETRDEAIRTRQHAA